MVIVWSTLAKQDLKAVYEYIAHDSKRYAERVTLEIMEKVETLPDLPHIGRVVPEIGEQQIREVSLDAYRIMYEVMTNCIYIHGVIHKRRDFKAEDLER